MIVLIVGPSGVGKTSAYKAIEGYFPSCLFRHLDGLASEWAVKLGLIKHESVSLLRKHIRCDELFLAVGLQAIGVLAGRNAGKNLVIDVGAGFQDAPYAAHLHRVYTIVAITGDPETVYKRRLQRGQEQRSLEAYSQAEYSVHRMAIYSSSQEVIDTTRQTLEETADRLRVALQRIQSGPTTC